MVERLLSDFDYDLPDELIAEQPLVNRSDSRLLCLNKHSGEITHLYFRDLPRLLTANDLIVLNDTRVIPARLFAHKLTGGKVEILLERIIESNRFLAQTKSSKPIKIGEKLLLTDDIWIEMVGRQDNLFELMLYAKNSIYTILEKFGKVPLPPYIKHPPTAIDQKRYQTIYATHLGAIAAPTAGLHFDELLMQRLAEKNIQTSFLTLHVGLGTFQPVRVENITEHHMHPEYIEVTENTCNKISATHEKAGKIIAVGTTTVRALESASSSGQIKPYRGDTSIFIYPGYNFKTTDILITNFHLPKTSLLMLVSAFAGHKNIMRAYQEAIKLRYRFYSYGDAMIII